jgi:hypothetical protein
MILDFYLKGFIPLATSNVREIKMVTKDQINIFISTNGAGKSSIMRELHPFPPDTSKFEDGGTKIISILHNGKIYKMTSVMGKEGYHKFEVDGENLNTGNTATAQRMLAESHFGITQATAKILSGLHITDLFNSMSPAKRKDFLMDLYPNDTSYAMDVYGKLKDEWNSLRGALRNQISRYAIEKQTLETLNKLSEDELLSRVATLDEEIREGLLMVGRLSLAKEHPQLRRMHEALTDTASFLLKFTVANPECLSREQAKNRVIHHENFLRSHQQKQEHHSKKLAELNEQVSLKDIQQDPKVLEQRAKAIEADLKHWNEKRSNLKTYLNDHGILMEAYANFGSRFVVALSEMKQYLINVTPSSVPNLTRQMYQEWVSKRDLMGNERSKTKHMLEEKQHRLAHYRGMESVECPKCDHTFKVGVTEQDINLLEVAIAGLTKQVGHYDVEIAKLDVLIENDSDWFLSMQALYNFLRQQRYTDADLAMVIREYDIGKVNGVNLVNAIDRLADYDDAVENIKPLEKEQQVNTSQINLLKQNYIGTLIKQIKQSEESINFHNVAMRSANVRLRTDRYLLEQMEKYDERLSLFKTQLRSFKAALTGEFHYQLKKEVDFGIAGRTAEKNHCMSEIIRSKSLHSVVDSIDQDIQRLKRRTKIVKALMDSLCPNKGFIGKLMLDFIKTFCGNTNAIIKEFSSITLMLKPCNKDNGDLTYRFPVVNGQNTEAADISDCSAGESEILNWAIRKVGMRYKPNWFPMFMDEVGAFLDEVNRTRFFAYIQSIFADKEHEQLFMVSHYAAQHGMFNNPNIIAINREGLTIQGKVNAHTIIQKG